MPSQNEPMKQPTTPQLRTALALRRETRSAPTARMRKPGSRFHLCAKPASSALDSMPGHRSKRTRHTANPPRVGCRFHHGKIVLDAINHQPTSAELHRVGQTRSMPTGPRVLFWAVLHDEPDGSCLTLAPSFHIDAVACSNIGRARSSDLTNYDPTPEGGGGNLHQGESSSPWRLERGSAHLRCCL